MFHINMIGTGIRYWICKIPMDTFVAFEKLHIKYKEDYENIFFDLEVLNKFGHKDWSDFYNIDSGRGFIVRERNAIEIKHKTKRLNRFESVDLIYRPLLVSPYKLLQNELRLEQKEGFKYIALIQYEKGSFFRFKLDQADFDINKLVFNMNYETIDKKIEEQFITHLTYQGKELEQRTEDVLCTGNKVLFL